MNYKRINNITGWVVCIIACAVFLMTMEATGSLWDCGEFASSAYKIQIPHPPGAPLFVLIGRLFMMPLDPHNAVKGLNSMSALASGFSILFLFWTITHFAKKMFEKPGQELTKNEIFVIMAAGAVGALAYTFTDSFWYSAVEGEVYGLSSFFTAIVFWTMVKWDAAVAEEQAAGNTDSFSKADKWIILIFYLMGLSIGVHLLNLLTIPAMVMMYYLRRYKPTTWGLILTFFIGCAITGIVQKAVIQWTITWAGDMDILFVNYFGMPFFSGFSFFFVLLAAIVAAGIWVANKYNWSFLRLALWSFSFMVLGYSTYFTTMIRSNADVAIDMYNVDNPVNLTGYLSRDQYGDWPIVYGQDFTAQPDGPADVEPTFIKEDNQYALTGRKITYEYSDDDKHLFPRMWDGSNDQGHADYYAGFAGIGKDPKTGQWLDKPDMLDNIKFFLAYQCNWMYGRYFMWNFVGKQNDIQGADMNNVRDGNWKSGISFWDNARLGDQKFMPDSMKHNKANNNLYALPLILGILGIIYQYMKNKNDALVVLLLFFFTGLAIAIYLNMPGNQPRERDYAFVGSGYAFAMWIGFGVIFVKEQFTKFMSSTVANYAALGICLLAVPVLMANQEWDDHDRSNKTLARDLAIDYLESCPQNTILITFGDNDTYPLWYAQEVEGIRRDIRVINSSLLGTDWYINQERYKVNKSDPIAQVWSADQIEGAKRDVVYYSPEPGIDPTKPMDLYTMMHDYAGSDDPLKTQLNEGDTINIFPSKKVTVPVDINVVRANGMVNANDSVVSQLQFDIPKNVLFKNESAILNIIAANKWNRPICFTSDYGELGFGQYLRQNGLTYQLVPVANGVLNADWTVDKMLNKFQFCNADKPGVYYDEENRRHLNSIRFAYAQAGSALADMGRKEDARKILEKCDQHMLDENFPYGLVSRFQQQDYFSMQFLLAAYKADDSTLAAKVTRSLKKDLEQQMIYYSNLSPDQQQSLANENQQAMTILRDMQQMEAQFKNHGAGAAAAQAADSTSGQ
ncbi:MAG TPA: DUF2723 domain-containing protein [Ferruginibacter sp.]|nr:DUF2723 domain-containing protein [Ferruginibacter sp.]